MQTDLSPFTDPDSQRSQSAPRARGHPNVEAEGRGCANPEGRRLISTYKLVEETRCEDAAPLSKIHPGRQAVITD